MTVLFSTRASPFWISEKRGWTGFHNAENLMAALGVGLALGVELGDDGGRGR